MEQWRKCNVYSKIIPIRISLIQFITFDYPLGIGAKSSEFFPASFWQTLAIFPLLLFIREI